MNAGPRHRWTRRATVLALALLPLVLMAWSWGCWPDCQVDFGRELYAAWRLTEGEHLYRDLAWFNGPLSAYWNALWLSLFGVSLRTLTLVNLALVYVALGLLVSLVRRWSSPVAAAAAGCVFLGVFAFGQYVAVGNYNFIAPYSHDIVHGLLLGLGALAALQRLGRRGGAGWAALAGVCVGLCFLTKAEVFVAAAGSAGVRLGLHLAALREGRWRPLAAFALGLLLPVAVAYAGLATILPAGAGGALLGSWAHLGHGELRELLFYRRMTGIDHARRNLAQMLLWGTGALAAAAAATALARQVPARRGDALTWRVAGFVLGLAVCALVLAAIEWKQLARPYPVYLAGAGLLLARRWWRARREPGPAALAADPVAFAVLAGLLLLKMLLNVRLEHYGFALALPATVLLVALGVEALPRLAARGGGSARLLRSVVLGALVAFVSVRLYSANRWYHGERAKTHVLGRGPDRLLAGWRGPALGRALEDLEQRLGPDDTLFVLPEGVMLNYLLRRRNPTPFVNFMPPELIFWGEHAVVAALHAAPPDVVALVHKDTLDDYGRPWFGSAGFGDGILSWVHARYEVAATYGIEPLTRPFGFGVQIWVPRGR